PTRPYSRTSGLSILTSPAPVALSRTMPRRNLMAAKKSRKPKEKPQPTEQAAATEQPAPSEAGAPNETGKPQGPWIVGIGASAGGLEAITALLRALPADTGMGFILVQHLDPTHPSALVEILAKTTSMKVSEAKEGAPVLPNHLYVIPPN